MQATTEPAEEASDPIQEAVADFGTLFDWIKQGTNQSTPNVYTWTRDGLEATHMAMSPSGEFFCVTDGKKFTVYVSPGSMAEGLANTLDMRGTATPASLKALVMRMTMAQAE